MTPDTHLSSALSLWQVLLVLAPSLIAGAAACFAGPRTSTAAAWMAARWATRAALAVAAVSLLVVLSGETGTGQGVRADALGALMSLLVFFVGWVIVRFSQPYLSGEHGETHYVRWMMVTLSMVGLVISSNHVLLLALAWTATSVALHRLLTFYSDRPAAVVAAHKKTIVARAADACMLCAAALLYVAFGTLHIDQIMELTADAEQIPLAAQAAVLLVACAALLKCAQLPFHGWLIQVMEAPTPVSALLHAGVVNLGGFVLLRFAPLVSEVPAAQVLLVVAGTTTAVVAALVMTTRISVKVMLAWSTCAQMGFMLMQCGLGVWEMALLHLVAHSLYKAHAFLGAGGAVRRASLVQLTPQAAKPDLSGLLFGVLLGMVMTGFAAWTVAWLPWGQGSTTPWAMWVLACVVSMALVPLLHAQSLQLGGWWLPALGFGAYGVALAYFGLHDLLSVWFPTPAIEPSVVYLVLCAWVALCFAGLFILQSVITLAPAGALARRLYPWFYGGLFLDERFNQLAFGLFAPPKPPASVSVLPKPGTSQGVRA